MVLGELSASRPLTQGNSQTRKVLKTFLVLTIIGFKNLSGLCIISDIILQLFHTRNSFQRHAVYNP